MKRVYYNKQTGQKDVLFGRILLAFPTRYYNPPPLSVKNRLLSSYVRIINVSRRNRSVFFTCTYLLTYGPPPPLCLSLSLCQQQRTKNCVCVCTTTTTTRPYNSKMSSLLIHNTTTKKPSRNVLQTTLSTKACESYNVHFRNCTSLSQNHHHQHHHSCKTVRLLRVLISCLKREVSAHLAYCLLQKMSTPFATKTHSTNVYYTCVRARRSVAVAEAEIHTRVCQ